MLTFKSQSRSIERSVSRYCNLAFAITGQTVPLEPEQQLAQVWGLSSPFAGTPTPLRQGNAARSRMNPGQPNKFRKGQGKGKQTQSKRGREQDDEAAGEEMWMDLDQLDEETVRRILKVLIKAATRHEQQLTSLESDRSFVFFMETGNHGLISMMIQASQAWHQKYEAGTVTTSLRATLWGVLLLDETREDRNRRPSSPDRARRRPTGSRGLCSSGHTRNGTQSRKKPFRPAGTTCRTRKPRER